MIENIENLRPELNVEGFRDAMNRDVFQYGEIQVHKFWSIEGIAPGIAQEISASAGNAGLSRGRTESLTLRGYSRSRLR